MTDDAEKEVLLQLRVSADDKRIIEEAARTYKLDTKQFVPLAAKYIISMLPTLEISPAGKDFAPAQIS